MSTVLHPVIRKATISRPEHTLEKGADRVAQELCASWPNNAVKFVERIEEVLGKGAIVQDASMLQEKVRIEDEGTATVVVDYPKMSAQWKGYSFDIRNTVAICRKEASTKNWTRVYLSQGLSYGDKTAIGELKDVYDKLASTCSKQSHSIFEEVVETLYKDNKVHSIGDFKILTFGIEDDNLGQYLDLFEDVDLKLKDLFTKNAPARDWIKTYYENLFGPDSVTFEGNDRTNHWLTSVSDYVSKAGFVEEGRALYNIKVDKDGIFALGIGHDVSGERASIARLSSLKIARYFGLEI